MNELEYDTHSKWEWNSGLKYRLNKPGRSPAAFILITGLEPVSIFNGNFNKQINMKHTLIILGLASGFLQEAAPSG